MSRPTGTTTEQYKRQIHPSRYLYTRDPLNPTGPSIPLIHRDKINYRVNITNAAQNAERNDMIQRAKERGKGVSREVPAYPEGISPGASLHDFEVTQIPHEEYTKKVARAYHAPKSIERKIQMFQGTDTRPVLTKAVLAPGIINDPRSSYAKGGLIHSSHTKSFFK